MKKILASITTAFAIACSAPIEVSTVPPDLEFGRLGERTNFERETLLAAAPSPTPTPPSTPAPTPGTAPTPGSHADSKSAAPPTAPEPPPSAGSESAPSSAKTSTVPNKPANQPDAPLEDPGEPDKRQRARTGLFWTGIVLIAAGGAGTIAFSAIGEGTEDQLMKGYDDGSLTRARDDQLRDRGEVMNALAITSAAVGVIGLAFATIAYGIDYTRCGKLAKRRRKPCKEKKK